MASVALTRHPSTPCEAIAGIIVDVATAGGALALAYSATGDTARVRIPDVRAPSRADGLWRQTCFEAFVKSTSAAYFELNFSPSTEWAVYRFSAYREGMSAVADIKAPEIRVRHDTSRLHLQATIDLASLPSVHDTPVLQLALAAVIEGESGALSYWAATHPRGKPDFHHTDSFSIVLNTDEARD
jgi:hypothetical protein